MNTTRINTGGCPPRGWRAQFANPEGALGRLIGLLMAIKNAPMNRLALEAVAPSPGERVLEIGFGPGSLLGRLADRVGDGRVAGADVSDAMVRHASRRFRRAVRRGRLDVHRAGVSHLPFDDGAFDAACAVNSYHLWPSPLDDLREVRRVLRDGGRLVLLLRMALSSPGRFDAPGLTRGQIERAAAVARAVGFREVGLERRDVGREVTILRAVR